MIKVEPNSGIVFTLVIPAYNEGDNLPTVLEDALATLNAAGYAQPFEILVIDDGSKDHTGAVADDFARRFPCIRAFHHAVNQGLGAGLRTGFANSRGKFVSWIPADGEILADQAVKLVKIAEDADFITTTRLAVQVEGKPEARPLLRRFLTWWMHQFCRVCLGAYPTHFTGIYLARGSYLRSVPLSSRTGLVGMELYFQSLRRGKRLEHGDMAIGHRLSGTSKVATPSGILKSLTEMLKIRWYLHKNRGVLSSANEAIDQTSVAA